MAEILTLHYCLRNSPRRSDTLLSSASSMLQQWRIFDDPPVDGRVINVDAPLSHDLFDFTVTEFIRNVIANNLEDDVGRKVATGKVDSHNAKGNE